MDARIQQMVDYCVQLEDRNERQHCAEAIIAIMDRMFPENRGVENQGAEALGPSRYHEWFSALTLITLMMCRMLRRYPRSLNAIDYPMQRIPVRHYGAMFSKSSIS